MNERIKELAELADDIADEKLQTVGEFHPDWHDRRDDIFVRLIMKDAINLLRQEWFTENNDKEEADGFTRESSIRLGKKLAYMKSVDLIVDHFGVE